MGEGKNRDKEWGIVIIIVAVFFLMSGLGMLDWEFLDEKLSTALAFVLVAVGVYLIAKG